MHMEKTFLSITTVTLVVLLSASLQSCSSYDSPLIGQKVSDITMESTESFYDVTFGNSDLANINAKSSENWCNPSVTNKSIRVNVQENDTFEERKAIVTLTDSEDGSSLTFNVIQKQNNVIRGISGLAISGKGGVMICHIETNVDYRVEIPTECNWIKELFSQENASEPVIKGLRNEGVYFEVQPNDEGKERQAIISFINDEFGLKHSILLIQYDPIYF